MFASLPIVSLLFLWLIFSRKNGCWRSSLLSAAILWGVLLTAFTEFLSIFRLLNFTSVLGLWILTSILLVFIYIARKDKKKQIKNINENYLNNNDFKPRIFLAILLGGVAFIVATVGLIALIAPPNTGDAMAYHMSRIVHWIQNQSVLHYPSHVRRQLYQNPWSEFAIMHFQILSGGDRFANLVQWFSMIGSILGVSLIAKELGADFRGQIYSCVICATIPMGILQASGVKNGCVVSLWLVCFVYYLLLLVNRKANWNFSNLLNTGASLGLALLTKGTAYVYALPFLIWLLISGIKKFKYNFWKPLITVGIPSLIINLGHYLRNFDLYGSPLSSDGHSYKNEVFGLTTLFSNFLRNIVLHLVTPIQPINKILEQGVKFLHKITNIDINDPRTSWYGMEFKMNDYSFNEVVAGAPLHLLLIIASILFFISQKNSRKKTYIYIYLVSVIAGFLLFCFLFKWSPWRTRLHLPIFVLFSPFLGWFLSRYNDKLAKGIVLLTLLLSLPYLFYNSTRPIIPILNTPRIEQYFADREYLKQPYIEGAKFLQSRSCLDIGLFSYDEDLWEYPFWVLLQKNGKNQVRIKHVKVGNTSKSKSGKHPAENFTPCAIIVVYDNDDEPIKEIITEEGNYQKEWSLGLVDILTKNSPRAD